MTAATQLDLLDLLDLLDQDAPPAMEPANSQPGRVDYTMTGKLVRHGTPAGYVHHRCRCDECRDWSQEYNRRRREQLRQSDKPIPHGTTSGYRDHGCRCDECHDWMRENHRRWRRDNPTKARSIRATRRARKKAAFVEHVDYAVVFERCEGRCQLCGEDLRDSPRGAYEFDHIWPLSRYGTHHYGNVRLLCRRCNQSKHAKVEQPWHVWLIVAHHSFWRRLDLDPATAPADPWADLDTESVPAAAIRPLQTVRKEA